MSALADALPSIVECAPLFLSQRRRRGCEP